MNLITELGSENELVLIGYVSQIVLSKVFVGVFVEGLSVKDNRSSEKALQSIFLIQWYVISQLFGH